MINNIRNTFIDMLNDSTWMGIISKSKAIEKVYHKSILFQFENIFAFVMQARAIDVKIGYPDYLDSDNMTKIEEDYAEVRDRNCFFRTIHIF